MTLVYRNEDLYRSRREAPQGASFFTSNSDRFLVFELLLVFGLLS